MSGNLMPAAYDNLFKAIISAGWANESDGNVESPEGYFALITIDENELESFVDAIDDPELTKDIPTGIFVTQENDQGFIYVVKFDTYAEANQIYRKLEADFGSWLAQELT